MKKKALCIASLCLILSGCSSGISQEQYESVSAIASSLESEKDALTIEKESLAAEKKAITNELESLNSEFSSYKESMSQYEGLALAEAEARKIETESKAAQESIAMEESKAAEQQAIQASIEAEEAAKAAEEAMGYETGITYDQLARTPDEFNGKKVKFSGKVIQVIDGTTTTQIRFAANNNYETIILCNYSNSIVSSRILENDKITIYGVSKGLYSYQSTLGATITIPSVSIDRIDQ